jgi:hypothetical protein
LPCLPLPFIKKLQPTQQKRNIPRNEPLKGMMENQAKKKQIGDTVEIEEDTRRKERT